jgi:hypothetical protein
MSSNRVSVYQAAEIMGVTVDAIRKRVSRRTIPHERDEDGRVWVILDIGQDKSSNVRDSDQPQSASDALISQMQERIASLERQLDQEREANSEHRRLLLRALERIPPQLEARESDVSPGPTGELGEVREELATEQARREMAESTLHKGMAEEQRRREEAERERDDLRRELYALRAPRQSPETVEQQQGRGQPHPATVEAQEGVRKPWRNLWRRIIRG